MSQEFPYYEQWLNEAKESLYKVNNDFSIKLEKRPQRVQPMGGKNVLVFEFSKKAWKRKEELVDDAFNGSGLWNKLKNINPSIVFDPNNDRPGSLDVVATDVLKILGFKSLKELKSYLENNFK